jgi:hypothetical protein
VRVESGQASIEWVGLVLLVALALGGALALGPHVDGRSLGGFMAHRFACAVEGGRCHDGDPALARAYGPDDAALVRANAPNMAYEPGERQLPVDFRRCRARRCADATLDRDADVHRTRSGERATVFTRLVRRDGRTYVEYWFYYPDSNTTWKGVDRLWERSRFLPLIRRLVSGDPHWPGFHLDDWEGYEVRIDPDGSVWSRATSHGAYQGCKYRFCRNQWVGSTGWTRVSTGSHAGHIPFDVRRRPGRAGRWPELLPRYPGSGMRERSSTGEGLRLVPLEPLREKRGYRPLAKGVRPPWKKPAYGDPASDSS